MAVRAIAWFMLAAVVVGPGPALGSTLGQGEEAPPALENQETSPLGEDGPPIPSGQESSASPREDDELVPPLPLSAIEVQLPEGAEAPTEVLLIRVLLVIDEAGAVTEVRLVEGAGEPWDGAVVEAARAFRFEPARYQGVPVAVEIPFEHRFLPPPPTQGEEDGRVSMLEGRVVEKGTLRPIVGGSLEVSMGEESFHTRTSGDGSFSIRTRDGMAKVEVTVTGYRRFMVQERLLPGEATEVRYLVERDRYDPYETTVVGRADRAEVSRTSLRDREIRQVPGTFGDPFRVIGALPGVTQMMSLLAYPIVRGSNPGATGVLIDGIRVPQLFHYLAGPAVIHPAFIDRVDFYPGNFPVEYGGYTGGIVDGITKTASRDERAVDLGIDLTNTSLFLRQPVFGATGTVAGRYGYPGLLLSAMSDDLYASYWDYQARIDAGPQSKRWTAFVFGSHDEAGPKFLEEGERRAGAQFHRLDLRYREGTGRTMDLYRLTLGTERIFAGEFGVEVWSAEPRVRWERPLTKALTLRTGAELNWRRTQAVIDVPEGPTDDITEDPTDDIFGLLPPTNFLSAGVFTDLPLWLGRDLLLTPGARIDAYETGEFRQVSFDPRLLWRYRVQENEASQAWLKGGIGLYHQPPRFPIPLPGTEEIALDLGLGQSAQVSLGAEFELRQRTSFDVQGFFNYMSPIFLEPALLTRDETQKNPEEDDVSLRDLIRQGRSYGLEVLVRRRGGGPLFGWISYTLSRAERHGDKGWELYEFDRTHILNAVAGIQLPRNWELGGRFQVQGGRPEKSGRLAPFTRFDLRIDRRVVYNQWMLDFYIDVINVMVAPEPLGDETETQPLRYLLPTVGFRAVL